MSLDVSGMVARGKTDRSECILCGSCVDDCRAGAIRYAWTAKAAPEPKTRTGAQSLS